MFFVSSLFSTNDINFNHNHIDYMQVWFNCTQKSTLNIICSLEITKLRKRFVFLPVEIITRIKPKLKHRRRSKTKQSKFVLHVLSNALCTVHSTCYLCGVFFFSFGLKLSFHHHYHQHHYHRRHSQIRVLSSSRNHFLAIIFYFDDIFNQTTIIVMSPLLFRKKCVYREKCVWIFKNWRI